MNYHRNLITLYLKRYKRTALGYVLLSFIKFYIHVGIELFDCFSAHV